MFDFLDGPVRELVTSVYNAVGYLGVALWVAVESVIIPIPSELVLPFAGFLVAFPENIEPLTGSPWNLWLTILAGTIGATVGAMVAYAFGYFGGRPLLLRWGRYLLIDPEDLAKTEAWFERYGSAAAFLGRMVPVVRSLVSFAAGVARMPLLPFVIFTFLGSLPWTALLVGAGYLLGDNWEVVGAWLSRFEYLVLAILALGVLGFIWWQLGRPGWERVRRSTGSTGGPDGPPTP